MKKALIIAIVLTLFAGIFSGCEKSGNRKPAPSPSSDEGGPGEGELSGNVVTEGSTSMEKVVDTLSKA